MPKESEVVETKSKKRKHIAQVTEENDISYRGPLSYRHFRIAAWVLFALGQIAFLLTLVGNFDVNFATKSETLTSFFGMLPNFMMPLFLVSTFAIILNAKNGYRKLIIQYTAAALGVFLAFVFVYEHYIIGLTSIITGGDRAAARIMFELIFALASKDGYIAFNIFIDMLLCTLFTFFINYHPTKYFKGKKIVIFRLFAILPIAYEIASIILKTLSYALDEFTLNIYFSPFLTTKPPLMFLAFTMLTIFIKMREIKYVRAGGDRRSYPKFLQTNTNSFHFSRFAAIIFAACATLDLIVFFIVTIYAADAASAYLPIEDAIFDGMRFAQSLGFGKCAPLFIISPIMLLFSYNRTYKNKKPDLIIPVAGIALTIFVYIEGMYWVLRFIPTLIK